MSETPDSQRLFARQALRTALVEPWFDALDLGAGDSVADLGCGAGYVSLRAAQRVGSSGTVHAVDSDPAAIQFLRELADLHGLGQIDARVESLDSLSKLPSGLRGAILSMVLHHVADRPAALTRIATATGGAPVLIAEFDDEGPCSVGPPRSMRLSRQAVIDALEAAGYNPGDVVSQSREHWFIVGKR